MIRCELSLWGGRLIAAVAGSLLLTVAPGLARADDGHQEVATSRVSNVALADLDLSTPNGMREAQRRLRTMAEGVCRDSARNPQFESQPAFVSCVRETAASQLRQIATLTNSLVAPRSSVTRSSGISLDDLDLSTARGYGVAKQRVETTVRRLCDELVRRRDLTPGQSAERCIQDGLAGAMAQVKAIVTAKESRLAARVAP